MGARDWRSPSPSLAMHRLLPALALLLVLAGCSSGSGTDDAACAAAGATASGTLAATAGGEAFSAACIQAQRSGPALSLVGIVNLDGSAGATQRQISITVPSAGMGTFQAPFGAILTYADVDLANPTEGTYAAISGSVTVDVLTDSHAEGSFAFTGRASEGGPTVQVTGGTFDVDF